MLKRPSLLFVAAGLALVWTLVPGAFLRGEVLSQGTLLYEQVPWTAYAPPDLQPANPLLTDPAFVFYPFLTHTVRTIRNGQLPQWSPALYAGHPFLGSFQSAVFSPFTAIALIVPLPRATVLVALAPLVVGGLGMFLFVRSAGLNLAARWFAGIGYLLNGFAVAWMEHPLTAVACWMPWVLLATDRLIARGGAGTAAALAACVSLVIVAGHPETATKILMLTGAYALIALAVAGRPRWAVCLTAYGAGVLLASVQILPFLEYLAHSEALAAREALPINRFFLPAVTMITALVPDFLGNPVRGTYLVTLNRAGGEANYAEQAIYAGMAVLLLAPLGLLARRLEWRVRFFASSALVALALMYGAPGMLQAVSGVPFLRVMILSRFGVITIFSLLVLAAYGVDHLTREGDVGPTRLDRAVLVTAAGGIGAIWLTYLAARGLLLPAGLAGDTARAGLVATVVLLAAAAIIFLRTRGTTGPRSFAVLICSLLAADLVAAGRGFHPTVPPSQVYPDLPELQLIRQDRGLFRVYGWGSALAVNTAMAYGLQDARGWDGINPHRYTRLLDLGYLRQSAEPERHLRDPALLDLLNVKYVFGGAGVSLPAPRFAPVRGTRVPLYVNTQAFPRAFLVDGYRVLSEHELRRTLHDKSVDLRRVALLESELPPVVRPEPAESIPALGTVNLRHYRETFVELEVESAGRRLLVLSDAHYPGWIATLDGMPVPILRADFALRAVPVPPGRHTVTFEYRPVSIRLGAALSGLTVAGLVAAVVLSRRRVEA